MAKNQAVVTTLCVFVCVDVWVGRRLCLLGPRENDENDENGGCHVGKGTVCQRHGFLFPEIRSIAARGAERKSLQKLGPGPV